MRRLTIEAFGWVTAVVWLGLLASGIISLRKGAAEMSTYKTTLHITTCSLNPGTCINVCTP